MKQIDRLVTRRPRRIVKEAPAPPGAEIAADAVLLAPRREHQMRADVPAGKIGLRPSS